ncbi:hypothetical protein B0H13DRAFT_2335973 [Mycena leptocephala]|nr:hypothetical protein B0H13DRAFT_2335973 [Mycena leptocephala]
MPHRGRSSMISFFPLLGAVLLEVLSVASQAVPSSWNSTLTTSTAERVNIARAALDTAIARIGTDGYLVGGQGFTESLFSQMAEFDIATNQTNYENMLEQYFAIVEKGRPNFTDTVPYGYAAVKAYTAYKNRTFLQYAVQSWWYGRLRTISQSDLSAGIIAGTNFTPTKVCQDATMVGGTFVFDMTGNHMVEALSTGLFLTLSALLAEATSDPIYLQAANDSASFILSHLYDPRNIVLPSISANDTSGCGIVGSPAPNDSGVMIEGLSILCSITKNLSTQNLLNDLLLAVLFNRIWQGDKGIVSFNSSVGEIGSLYLVQGLGSAYTHESMNSTLRQHVGEYITVQFNAVTGLATSGGTNIYGQSWTGPPNASFLGSNQVFALAALISAIGLEDEFPPTPTPSSPLSPSTSSNPPPNRKSTHTAAIAGGSVGGIVFLAFVLATLWLLRRQRSRAHNGSLTRSTVPEPFLASHTAASHPREKRRDHRNPRPPSAPIISVTIHTAPDQGNSENAPPSNRQWDGGEAPPDYPAT